MLEVIAEGTRTARKPHRCFDCYRTIEPGAKYGFQTCKYDHVYTLCWHLDCHAMALELRSIGDCHYDDVFGPLRDELQDSGAYSHELDLWRGLYPHVVCRMELTDQLREARQ